METSNPHILGSVQIVRYWNTQDGRFNYVPNFFTDGYDRPVKDEGNERTVTSFEEVDAHTYHKQIHAACDHASEGPGREEFLESRIAAILRGEEEEFLEATPQGEQ